MKWIERISSDLREFKTRKKLKRMLSSERKNLQKLPQKLLDLRMPEKTLNKQQLFLITMELMMKMSYFKFNR